jgi:hypothetical protein
VITFTVQILYSDTCFTAQALVRLFVDLNEKNLEMLENGRADGEPRFEDVAATLQLLGKELAAMRQLLEVGSTYSLFTTAMEPTSVLVHVC